MGNSMVEKPDTSVHNLLFITVSWNSASLAIHSNVIRELCNDTLITNYDNFVLYHLLQSTTFMTPGFRSCTPSICFVPDSSYILINSTKFQFSISDSNARVGIVSNLRFSDIIVLKTRRHRCGMGFYFLLSTS